MARTYLTNHVKAPARPMEAIFRREADMTKMRSGGYGFKIDQWSQLDRLLILGTESPTYYAGAREMTLENVGNLDVCMKEDGARVVRRVGELDRENRAPRRAPLVFTLALALKHPEVEVRREAKAVALAFCRTASQLFELVAEIKAMHGKVNGRLVRSLISDWYNGRAPEAIAYQATKYGERSGFSHRDALMLAHAKPVDAAHGWVYKHLLGKTKAWSKLPPLFKVAEEAKAASTKSEIVSLITEHRLVRELVPQQFLSAPEVWEALLVDMPTGAMVRNLGKMTSIGLLAPMSKATKIVVNRLEDPEIVAKSRIHPVSFLSAMAVYGKGRGFRGNLSWSPVPAVCDALEAAFLESFNHAPAAGSNHLLAVDVSASMTWPASQIAGLPFLYARDAAACMLAVTLKREPWCHAVAFSAGLTQLPFTARASFAHILRELGRLPASSTDISAPIRYATEARIEVDTFVIYTDNEQNCGPMHPAQAIEEYRQKMGRPAKMVVCAMAATNYSMADPCDGGMLDVVGFDASAPSIIADFGRVEKPVDVQ